MTGNVEGLLPFLLQAGFYQGRSASWPRIGEAENIRIARQQLGLQRKYMDLQRIQTFSDLIQSLIALPDLFDAAGDIFGAGGGGVQGGGGNFNFADPAAWFGGR